MFCSFFSSLYYDGKNLPSLRLTPFRPLIIFWWEESFLSMSYALSSPHYILMWIIFPLYVLLSFFLSLFSVRKNLPSLCLTIFLPLITFWWEEIFPLYSMSYSLSFPNCVQCKLLHDFLALSFLLLQF
jgi:hypothetical protein